MTKFVCKKALPVLLALLMLVSIFPVAAHAESPDITIEPTSGAEDTSTSSAPTSEVEITTTPNEGGGSSSLPGDPDSAPPDSRTAPAESGPEDGDAPSSDSTTDDSTAGGAEGETESESTAHGGIPVTVFGAGGRALRAAGSLTIHSYDAYQWDFSKGTGPVDMRPWYIMTIDGALAYCVEPTNPETTSGGYGTIDYTALGVTQQYSIGYAMLYGAQDISNPLLQMATQVIIWEIALGYMDLSTFISQNQSAYDATIGYNPAAAGYYQSILSQMRGHREVPSFTRFLQAAAPLHTVPGIAGEYKLDLVNTNPNCDLASFSFANTGGVSFVRENQTLHVTSSGPLDGNTIYAGYKGASGHTSSLIFWTKGAEQVRATASVLDPVPAFFRLVTENMGQYKITVIKLESGTNSPLAGAEFTVRHSEKGTVGTYTTNGSGRLTVSVPWQGTYIITEITPPSGHLLSDSPVKDVVISTEHPNATVTFHNESFSGIQITKVDATTKARIPGVTFRIARQGGGEYQDVVTGPSGIASLPNLKPDVYIIREISCPPAYILDTQERLIEVKSGQVTEITIENYSKPSLEVRKVDEASGLPLAGATFRVSYNGTWDYKDIVSGLDGIARLTGMKPGYYTVTEIVAPEGYVLNDHSQEVEIIAGQVAHITITNAKKPVLKILKIDSITKQPLQYATFRVSYKATVVSDSSSYGGPHDNGGKVIGTFTSDIDGRVLLEGLEPGLIVIEEITAPDGYIVSNSPLEVLIAGGEVKSVTFENTPKSPVILKKIDSATGQPLAGAQFRLTRMNGELIGEYTTGRYGYITVPGLEPGWYTAVEIFAPAGYKLNDAPQNVELKLNGDPGILEFENTALPGLLIKKVDSVTGEALAGVEFTVSKLNGERIGTYTTGEAGYIFIENITEKYIVVRETKTLPGYKIDDEEKIVTIEAGKLNTVTFQNIPLPDLLIKKIDSVTGKGMAGVEFALFTMDGAPLGSFTTGEDGTVLIADIDTGAVLVRETKTLPGYRIDTAEQTVKLEIGVVNEVMFTNSPWPYLVIQKQGEDKQPLPGAVFKISTLDGKEIGSYTTNEKGRIVLTGIDAQTVLVQEIEAPEGYALDDRVWEVELQWGMTTTVTLKNVPLKIEVEVEKRGLVVAVAGQEIRYDFRNIQNKSTVPLDDFYWYDILPTDAVRLTEIFTGTWNEDLTYKVLYRTNLKDNWAVLAENLITSVNHRLVCSPQVLGLASNEFVTEFRFEFGRVKPGFQEEKQPYILCRVLAELPDEYQFVNRTEVGGRYGGKWTYDRDAWVTVVFKNDEPRTLPKTGVWV